MLVLNYNNIMIEWSDKKYYKCSLDGLPLPHPLISSILFGCPYFSPTSKESLKKVL